MNKAFKYRIYPNKFQQILFAKTFGCVRVIWNACVESFNSYDKEINPNLKIIDEIKFHQEDFILYSYDHIDDIEVDNIKINTINVLISIIINF